MNLYLTKNAKRPLVRKEHPNFAMMKFMPANDTELKALGEDLPDGYIAGWASTPDLDSYRHVVQKGAFDDAISAKGLSGPKSIKLLIGHDWNKVAGVIKVLETRGERLWIEAELNLNISYVRDAYEASKMAGGLNFSVGFSLQDYEFKEDSSGFEYLLIKKGDLFEVSVVPFPGNEECTMDFVKNSQPGPATTVADFEKLLVARGLVKSRNDARSITQEVKSALHIFQKGPGTAPAAPPAPDTQPVLAADQLKTLSNMVAELKTMLTR